MADDATNTIVAEEGRSRSEGNVPDGLRRRYYVDERGGRGVGFYVDARIKSATFRDEGARLTASRADPNAIRDMVAIAQHRGWTVVVVRGEVDFRREAWLTATAAGIETRGYRPSERDRQELERRKAAVTRRQEQREARSTPADLGAAEAASVRRNVRVVETVVRARVVETPAQERILAAARERLAQWLERGAQVHPVATARAPDTDVHRPRERQRSR